MNQIKLLLCSLLFSLFCLGETHAQVKPLVAPGGPSAPGPVSGPTSVAMPTTSSQYTVPAIAVGITLHWSLSPSTAGTISASINVATVSWNASFAGSAVVSVTASNSVGTSVPSTLTVSVKAAPVAPPTVSNASPASQTINYNAIPATLSATASGGNGTYSYQWQSSPNNTVWTNITGATSASYTPGASTLTTWYQLVVTSNGVSNSSSSAAVIVNPATNPANIVTSFSTAMNHIFSTLNTANIPTGILRDYGMESVNLENFDGTALVDSNIVDAGVLRSMYQTLGTARMTSAAVATLPNTNTIDSLLFKARQPGQVTLCGLFYQYSYLNTSVNPNPNITITNGQLFDKTVNGVWQNPYLQGQTLGFAPASAVYNALNFNLVLPTNLWLTNSAGTVSSIQIDAGDGLGYRTITPGTALPVSYTTAGLKVWNFKVSLSSGTVLQSHSQITVNGTVNTMTCFTAGCGIYTAPGGGGGSQNALKAQALTSNATATPTDVISGVYPNYLFATGATYNGINAQGMVTMQYASGHTSIVNPLIVVEGFDIGYYTNPESYAGTTSIQSFLTNVNYSGSASLISMLGTPSTYDIIYITFKNGTDDIRRNALLVASVVRWVNANKTSTNKNVVIGLSMGGLCARYALKKMENNGETHQVKLFVCHGTPQQGAVVPLGLQALEINVNSMYLNSGLSGAYNAPYFVTTKPNIDGILTLSSTPAALQMLVSHLNNNYQIDNTVHNAWQTELTTLGYPTQASIRNVAISNGSECGQAQTLALGGQLFSLNGKANTSLLGDLAIAIASPLVASAFPTIPAGAFIVAGLPGRNSISLNFVVNAANNTGGNLAYSGNVSYTKTLLWILPITITLNNQTFNTPSGVLPYETFAGDYYPIPFSSEILSTDPKISALAKYNISLSAAPNFGFVPVPSVLDIGSGLTTLSESDYQTSYSGAVPLTAPKTSPFTDFITAYNNGPANQEHITYNQSNGNWLANELNGTYLPTGCAVLCPASTMTGSPTICAGSNTYSVPSISGVTYTWVPSAGLQIISGQSTASVQVQASATSTLNQQFTLQLLLSSGTCTNTVTQTITYGVAPTAPLSGPTSGATSEYTFQAPIVQGATAWNWSTSDATNARITGSSTIATVKFVQPGLYGIECAITTPCGIVQDFCQFTATGGSSNSAAFVIFPNPASSTMSVALASNVSTTTLVANQTQTKTPTPFTYKLYNKMGQVVMQGKSKDGSTVQFDTSGLLSDHYFMHITCGDSVIEQQVEVAH